MRQARKIFVPLMLSMVIISYSVAMSYLSIKRHLAFASGYDLANMAETVWQSSQGNLFSLTGTNGLTSRFTHHTDLILLFLVPFYKLFPDTILLLIVQSIAIALSAIPIYLISQLLIKQKLISLTLVFIFLINPGVLWTNIYDFHPVSLAIPLLFSIYYCLLVKNYRWLWVFIVLILLTKENLGLLVAALGFLVFLKMKDRKTGLAMMLIGASFSLIAIKYVMPAFSQGSPHWAWSWFDFSDRAISKFKHNFILESSFHYYRDLLKPYAYLPLLGGWNLLPALPDFLINSLSKQGQMKSIVFHYDSLISVVILVNLILVLSRLKGSRLLYPLILVVLFFSLKQNYHYSPLPTTPGHWKLMYYRTQDEINFQKALKQIPLSAIVTSSSEIRPHIVNHRLSYNLPNGIDQSDYIAIVDQNRLVGDYEPKEFENQLISRLQLDQKFQLIFQQGHFYLYQRNQ